MSFHAPVSHSNSSPPSPHHSYTDQSKNSSRRSSICTPSSEILVKSNYFQPTTPHRRSRSFRDGSRSPRQLPLNQRYTTFEFENTKINELEQQSTRCSPSSSVKQQKRFKPRPPPLKNTFSNPQSASSSVCSSASTTQTSVFFNTSTESTNSSRNYSNRATQPCSPNGLPTSTSNWSMCSEYSTTSSVAKAQNGNFPRGKLAYLASRRGSSGSVGSTGSICTTSTPPATPSGYSRLGATSARRQSSGNFLEVPPSTSIQSTDDQSSPASTTPTTPTQTYTGRSRVNSLPAASLFSQTNLLSPTYPYFPSDHSPTYTTTPNPRNEDYLYRLRTFNITSSGDVVNCGDTFVRKSKSNNCITSEQTDSTSPRKCSLSTSPTRSQRSSPCHRRGSLSPRLVVNYPLLDASCCVSRDESDDEDLGSNEDLLNDEDEMTMRELAPQEKVPVEKRYRVVLLGDAGVGKSALVRQFMTSDYINTYDMSLDEEYGEREVSILLDKKESSLVFVDHPSVEMSVENSLATYDPHACVVVYSVTDKHSFEFAGEVLRYLWQEKTTHVRSVILVGNKCDLARARVISTQEGKNLATSHDTKFIETSSGIQHNVDELLVGVLKQIRLREEASTTEKRSLSDNPSPNHQQSSHPSTSTQRQQPQTTNSQRKDRSTHRGGHTPRGSIMSLLFTRELINKLCFLSNKAKSCENLHVL